MNMPPAYFAKLKSDDTRRRDLFIPFLWQAGIAVYEPKGAYDVMTDIIPLGWNDDTVVVKAMIEHAGVSGVPGSSFIALKHLGKTMVRFIVFKKDKTLKAAGDRL